MFLWDFFSCHSSSLDTESETAYDNYKNYDSKLNILCFPGITTNRKNVNLLRTEQTHYYLLYYMVNKHFLGSSVLLCWYITLKHKKKLDNFQFFVLKMTRQSLILGKLMADQVLNTFGHVW